MTFREMLIEDLDIRDWDLSRMDFAKISIPIRWKMRFL